jgi:hypothetical protein
MARAVPVEIEVARAAYLAALNRWLADPYRREINSRSRAELAGASRLLRATLRNAGVGSDGRMPPAPPG